MIVLRRSRRHDDTLPVVARDVRIAGFRRGWQVRQRLRALLAGHREAPQLALMHLLARPATARRSRSAYGRRPPSRLPGPRC